MKELDWDDKYYIQNTIKGYFVDTQDVKHQVTLDLENKSMVISVLVYANTEQYLRSDCRKYTEQTKEKAKELLGLENGTLIFGDVCYDPETSYKREGIIFYQIDDEFINKIHALTVIKMKGKKNVY